MARSRAPRIARDSTCFIAWADRAATESPSILQALDVKMTEMTSGRLRIVASQVIELEVRPGDVSRTQRFHQQLRACPYFESFSESPAIRRLAHQLQDRLQESERRGGYADLLHVATAIAARAEEFWTTDKRVVNWHTQGVIGEIRIVLPYLQQGVLELEE